MPKRLVVFAVLAIALASLFVRLGFWQLARHEERKAFNARVARPLSLPEVPFDSASRGETYRLVVLEGVPDTANELVISGRSRNGTPGIHVVTPYRRPGGDTAVLVNRGWVYAPDAATADLRRFRETLTVVHGYMDSIPGGAGAVDSSRPRTLRRFTLAGVEALVPYPVSRLHVVLQDSGSVSTPARLPAPRLSNGPHLGYAVQWFSFAFIGLAGTAIVLTRGRRTQRGGSTGAKE